MKCDAEDSKYRWVLLFCCMAVNVLTWGALYSVGVFYVRWVDDFGALKSEVAVVGGLPTGTGSLLGPVFGAIIDRIGFRKAGIVGGIILAFSHLVSSFAPNLIFLGVTYGFFAGAGAGLSNYASAIALNYYFKKERAFAEGIVTTGVGIGNFLLTITYQELLNEYDWGGTMIILSGILANVIPLCQLMVTLLYLERFQLLRRWKSKQNPSLKQQKEVDDVKLEQGENPVYNDDPWEANEMVDMQLDGFSKKSVHDKENKTGED